jgi:hypothetical protein
MTTFSPPPPPLSNCKPKGDDSSSSSHLSYNLNDSLLGTVGPRQPQLHYKTPKQFINTNNTSSSISNNEQESLASSERSMSSSISTSPSPINKSLLLNDGNTGLSGVTAIKSSSCNNNNNNNNDTLESRFLNKLCEEIEVSLNVDCECADDYSSNDFSGMDYSFDNEALRAERTERIISPDFSHLAKPEPDFTQLTELRRTLENNIKTMRADATSTLKSKPKNEKLDSNNNNNNNNARNVVGVLV